MRFIVKGFLVAIIGAVGMYIAGATWWSIFFTYVTLGIFATMGGAVLSFLKHKEFDKSE